MKKILLLLLLCCTVSVSFAFTTQNNWRWRNDNGGESSATWKAAQNKPIIVRSVDSVIRLRIQFNNTTGDVKGINSNLQYASAPDGPWRYVTSLQGNNAFVLANANSYIPDLAATTRQITGSANPFAAGKVLVRTTTLALQMANNTSTEFEYCLKPTGNISPGTVYYFRVPGNDYPVALPTLQTSATINVNPKSISNGSFENDLQDWTFSATGAAAANYSFVDTLHRDGVKALFVNVAATGKSTDIRLVHKATALTAGKTYMVRFWAKAKKNAAKLQLAVKGSKTLLYDYKLYTGWEEFQFAFKAQSSSASIAFLFQQATQYVIDNVELLDENNAAIDVSMNYMWQNKRAENAYSWLSADGVYSEPLPDGRTVWTCSDGWYGYNDSTTNSMETHQLLRNTLIVQDAATPNGNLVTKIGGTVAAP